MLTTQDLLSRLYEAANSPNEQGELFERFVAAYLRNDNYYGQRFANVWRWSDWPGTREGETDLGIDLVAEERETGAVWAIQAKSHQEPLGLSDIATFLALSGRQDFDYRMLVTTSPLTSNAESVLDRQEKPVIVLTLADILQSPVDWDAFQWNNPEKLTPQPKKQLYPYQEEAVEAVIKGFERSDRGKLIMPPGSGKTFVALKIAERLVGPGGCVLFLAPSIALVEQTLRAWLADTQVPLRVYAVTSDRTVGRDADSLDRTTVLTIPPTTDAAELAAAAKKIDRDQMTLIVSTYHSIDVVIEAQALGLPEFDLIIADEAHRTTGVMQDEKEASYYHKVHDNSLVCGAKRLYMTATPRVFVPRIREKLEELGYDYFSMDDEHIYGEEFFRYGFGQAVEAGFLSDYKVVVFTVSEADVQRRLFEFLNREDTPEVEEAAKIVGVWNALSGRVKDGSMPPLKRGVVFAGTIADSKAFGEQFVKTAEAYYQSSNIEDEFRRFDVRHIDGSMTATERKLLLDWLREEPGPGETRVLSNAKVLTEGVDVPALDAVVFLKPRRSVVEVVQAVGRVMRRAPGKQYGYVILPVIVDPYQDAAKQLDTNEQFRTVWEILGALRSIDDRFDAMVRELWIQRTRRDSQEPSETGDDAIVISGFEQATLDFEEELYDAIVGKIVERVGDRAYLESWARDVAAVTIRLERHISEALQHGGEYGRSARQAFSGFVNALREVINPSITEEEARGMLVQHIITKPIFDAIFSEYKFLEDNAVARSFERLASMFEAFVDKETQVLKNFYRLVRVRARGLDKEQERQEFLRHLYDTFFKVAFPKIADRLGIVFTPVEVVDFLIDSAEVVLQTEFGRSLEDKGVVVLEPFAGTGTFLARLMHRLSPEALERKYSEGEIWGNEILLLPYYIALANVESIYYEISGKYQPFHNLLLVDSFQLMEEGKTGQIVLFPEQYTELMQKQREAKINVIISNPPWFAWQENENLGIAAVEYPKLNERIGQTYAAYSSAQNKNSLYDSYIRAIRMATDRIADKGVIAFVTNSGFLDGMAADGLRKCLAEEFARIYIVNLRGNARTSGELRRMEGGGIFGEGSRAGVALLVLVKDTAKPGPAEIYYHDIGDYLRREEKLARLKEYRDISGLKWNRIVPNDAYDWINQRSDEFMAFPAMGTKDKGDEDQETIFNLYSRGLQTGCDAWTYNLSRNELTHNMCRMIDEFNRHVDLVQAGVITRDNLESQIDNAPKKIAWSKELKRVLLTGHPQSFDNSGMILPAVYRPFVRMWLYYSRAFNQRRYQQPRIFPEPGVENMVIAVQAPGGTKEFSVLMTEHISDLHFTGDTQAFPLYTYEPAQDRISLFDGSVDGEVTVTAPSGNRYIRRENVTDWALEEYRKRYGVDVGKADIFYYVYGVLHS
ncbi:MAG: DEAD/DEAH box helicase, partial [Firmicutes bacterium]|nr:DEAD/DEAH box helicase [Bacillota bacterium]